MRPFPYLAVLACLLAPPAPAHAQSSFPPAPAVKVAVNPVTDKVYLANTGANTVTAYDAASGNSTTIAVGAAPAFIAVNPATNRVYVDNEDDATLSVIDGATDTLIDTYPIGSAGPIAIDPVANVVYVVRLTGTGSDEVTFFNGETNTWYTIATSSFQPTALAVNPATSTIYVAHYGTGDLRVISGVFDPNDDFPAGVSIGMFSHPFAVAVNPVTNKVYVLTQDARGPIAVVNGADNGAVFPAISPGHAQDPHALVVDPVANKAYAAFANEVIAIDGATNALTYIPIGNAGSGAIALGIDYTTHRVYAATAPGSLSVIDGDTNAVLATEAIPAGTSAIGVNPLTGMQFFFDTALATRTNGGSEAAHAIPLTVAIQPLAGDASGPGGTITMSAASNFAPTALAVRAVYWRLDSKTGPWTPASGGGPYTASFTGLAAGSHTLFAFAADGQDAPLATGPQSNPLVGQVAAYTFTVQVAKATPSVSLASSVNPSASGQPVTFTASVAGSAGTPTGSVDFLDGTTPLCAAVALAGGAAQCATSTLASGTHPITAQYSGDASYDAGTSSPVSQVVAAAPVDATVTLASSSNPAQAGATVTFTATVAGGAGTPTGSVDFRDAGASIAGCAAVTLAAGSATCTTAVLAAGSHSITAVYSGDGAYRAGTSNALAQDVMAAPPPPDADPPRLGNLSTRAGVLTGEDVMIGGFVIGGSAPKTVAITATGPSLAAFGVANPLANPQLTLVRSSDQSILASNDDWQSDANAARLQASGFAPADARESGLLVTLAPGAYTAIVQGANGGTGVAVVAVFEVDHPEEPLANISTRAQVRTGEDVMIGGFVVQGSGPQTVVVSATGPSLAAFGIAHPLANPTLTLVRSADQAVIAANDDWQDAPNAAQIRASGFAPSDPHESAVMVTLDPGAYTAIVSGTGSTTGIAVVGAFRIAQP